MSSQFNGFARKFGPSGARKYGAKRTITEDGASFPSRLEARRWGQLLQLQEAGALSDLRRQPKVLLTAADIVYHPDFCYQERGRLVFEETKGFDTKDWLLKLKLWRVYGPGVLRVMKAVKGGGIRTSEEVHPRAIPEPGPRVILPKSATMGEIHP